MGGGKPPTKTMRLLARLRAGGLWLHARRKKVNAWAIRAVSFYFGYTILHHEIYTAKTTDPLLVFLGLWLCGVAPATFFDSMRKANDVLRAATDTSEEPPEIAPAHPTDPKEKPDA